MSWFNEKFGDSLSSLKGQITKITKEVLAEDDTDNNSEEPGSIELKFKEFEELCASKDRVIDELRRENAEIREKFEEELKILKDENTQLKSNIKKIDGGDVFLNDDQIRDICELEDQLQQLKIERDHLEELEKDHQSNICQVVQQRDSYKQELEKLKGAHSALQGKYETLTAKGNDEMGGDILSDINLTENKVKNDELNNLREIIEKLQTEIESHKNEKEEMSKVIEGLELNSEKLKGEIENLMEEVKILAGEKKSVDSENEKLKDTINNVAVDLNGETDHHLNEEQKITIELEEKVKELTQTLDVFKNEQTDFEKEFKDQLKKLAQIFFTNNLDKYSNMTFPELMAEIEKIWKNMIEEREFDDRTFSETLNNLQKDIESLRNDNSDLRNQIECQSREKIDMERTYKTEVECLQSHNRSVQIGEQERIIRYQAEEVENLKQEVSELLLAVETRTNELSESNKNLDAVTKELNALKTVSASTEHDFYMVNFEKEENLKKLKNDFEKKENEMKEIMKEKKGYLEKCKILEDENALLLQKYNSLQDNLDEAIKANEDLKNEVESLRKIADRLPSLEERLNRAEQENIDKDRMYELLNGAKIAKESDVRKPKSNLSTSEIKVSALNEKIQDLTEELVEAKSALARLENVEQELAECRETMGKLQMHIEEVAESKQLIHNECIELQNEVDMLKRYEGEAQRLKRENEHLTELCRKLQNEIQNRCELEFFRSDVERSRNSNSKSVAALQEEICSLREIIIQQTTIVAELQTENKDIRTQWHLANDNVTKLNAEINNMREDYLMTCLRSNESTNGGGKKDRQRRKRSKSDSDFLVDADNNALKTELENLQKTLQYQTSEYKRLKEQYNSVVEKEAHSKRELERLKLHLIEAENYYTETINEYKAKLRSTEDHLRNSSSFLTSNKVRNSQQVEALQNQIRLLTAQRDSLHEELVEAQEELQRQNAALVSFHLVLEQFQQDKNKELKGLADKYEKKLSEANKRFDELKQENESLANQLIDAKNGLQAASRLGEQLEKKNEYIADLEGRLIKMQTYVKDLEEATRLVSQSDAEKVDKSLLKNLIFAYFTSQKEDRKEQILRIMMSILDFDEEEKSKMGIDSSQPGWLASLLRPKGENVSASESLSEAFIRFLESESRPQPQLKLLPEDASAADKSKSGNNTPRPFVLEELVLPTFNSPEPNDRSVLKDVLNNP